MSENGLTTQQKSLAVGSRGVQLTSLEDAWRFSQAVVQSGLAPSSFKTAQQVLIAIQYGAEVGFPPMQALQSVAVVNGRPCLWGDALPALVRQSGACEYIKEWIDGDGDNRTAHCETKRAGESEPCRRSFSVADAKRAGLWMRVGRNGQPTPWVHYPERMLAMRARSWCLRDTYADAMRGLQVREEVEDYSGSTMPAEVIEQDRPRRLSEITEEPDYGPSYAAIRDAIEATADDDADALDGLYVELGAALDDGGLTESGRDALKKLLAVKVPS